MKINRALLKNTNTHKTSAMQKNTIKRTERRATEWEKKIAKYKYDKGFVSKIYKELIKLSSRKANNQI